MLQLMQKNKYHEVKRLTEDKEAWRKETYKPVVLVH